MKASFAVKLGIMMITLVISLVGSILVYFYQYSQEMMLIDLKQSIGDVTRTSAFVFKEEERKMLSELKDELYHQLPDNFTDKVNKFSKNSAIGDIDTMIAESSSGEIHNSMNFQYIVQLLRRIQEGSRDRVTPLNLLKQTNILDANASRVAWVYLLVKIPGVPEKDAIMFLADSNYEVDNLSTEGNFTGNLYKPKKFFVKPFQGEIGLSDEWYTDLFGEVMTAIVPIKDENGAVIAALGIDYGVASFQERIEKQKTVSWMVFSVSASIALLMTFIVIFWVSVPLAKLREGAEQLSKQDFNHKVNLNSQDEFGVLAKTINQVSISLGKFTGDMENIVARRTKELTSANNQVLKLNKMLTQENVHLGAEVDSLIKLRENMLIHQNKIIKYKHYDIDFQYLASRSVCGDFWQHLGKNEDSFEFCTGHVSGYGLETAMTVLQLQALLKASTILDVDKQLSSINQFLHENQSRLNNYLFAKLMIVELFDTNIRLSGYGEVPIMFTEDTAQAIVFEVASSPFGVEKNIEISQQSFKFNDGESMLIYSTGFRNAIFQLNNRDDRNIQADEFMTMTGLQQNSGKSLVEKLSSQEWFEDFKDDISFVVIEKRHI